MAYRVERLDNGAATYITNYILVALTTVFAIPFLDSIVGYMFLVYAVGNLVAGYMHQFLKPKSKITDVFWISAQSLVGISNTLLLVSILTPIVSITSMTLILIILCVIGGTIYSEKVATMIGGGLAVLSSVALVGVANYLSFWLPQAYDGLPLVAWVGCLLNIVYVITFITSKPSKWINFWLHILAIGHYCSLFVFFVLIDAGGLGWGM